MSAVNARVAGPDDVRAVTEIISSSFHDDPVWGDVAFPDRAGRRTHHDAFWAFQIASAMRYPWTYITPGFEAAAVWIPPGGTEFTPDEEDQVEPFLRDLVGPEVTAGLVDIFARFTREYPASEPHYYLSLLGTHDAHRGQGLGMRLLQETLDLVDADHMPAYLESTNPANDARYARVGFEPRGEIVLANDQRITTMWRSAR
jgi:GNAT superfamily N-acetyltransferase